MLPVTEALVLPGVRVAALGLGQRVRAFQREWAALLKQEEVPPGRGVGPACLPAAAFPAAEWALA